jgi:hypothetical protein
MQFLLDLGQQLRALADRGVFLQSDTFSAAVKRSGLGTVWKLCRPLYEIPELWDDDCPEADPDGIPTSTRLRDVLLALIDGPRKVDALARALKVERPRLYDQSHSLKDLVQLGLAELTEDGYQLTAKGRRTASLIAAEREE